MHPDSSLKENVTHGTEQNPITGIHFESGPGTDFPDHFFVARHWHPTVEILYITKGTYLFEINLIFIFLVEQCGHFCIIFIMILSDLFCL